MADAYGHHYANVHRGIYELSEDATARFEAARARVARFIGAPSQREIVFVRNATEAINLVAYSWGRTNVAAGDLILSTEMEHHANLVPWQQLAAETGATLEYVAITDDGRLDLDDLRARLARGPKLVAINHVSNALGTINPVAEISRMAHEAGALVVLDAAQSVPHMPVDVAELGVDFLALSGHKMLGPSGIGALWGRRELLDAMPPFMTGGSMISKVTLDGDEWNEVPLKFEAGTPAIAEAAGLGAAIGYLEALGMANVRAHERCPVRARLVGPRRDPRRAAARSRVARRARRRDQLRDRRHPSARRGDRLRPPRRRGARRPPLRAAGHGSLRPSGHDPRQLLRLQRPRRRRRAWPRRSTPRSASSRRAEGPMDNLYRDFILEHYRAPHNKGVLDPHDLHFADSNPTCGDEMSMTLLLDDAKERVADVAFDGRGCAISQASASILTDELRGLSLDELRAHGPEGRSSRTSACRSARPA